MNMFSELSSKIKITEQDFFFNIQFDPTQIIHALPYPKSYYACAGFARSCWI